MSMIYILLKRDLCIKTVNIKCRGNDRFSSDKWIFLILQNLFKFESNLYLGASREYRQFRNI